MSTYDEELVQPEWLVRHLDTPNLVLVDCRFTGDRDSSRQAYLDGHLPGAVHSYWLDDLCDADTRVTSFLPDAGRAALALGALGIGSESVVVGYSDTSNLYASRLWHVLRCLGHAEVRLLDGGISAWVAVGGTLETAETARTAQEFIPRAPLATLATATELLQRLDDRTLQILDVRALAEFDGTTARAARGGHIPGARLLPWTDLVGDDERYLEPPAIADRCRAAGLDPTREVVTYCQGGVRAARTALALQLAGFTRVRVYDGSWAEWGNNESLPIESSADLAT